MSLTRELKQFLSDHGAKLIGIGCIGGAAECEFPVGVSVALPLPEHLVEDLQEASTEEYYHVYHSLNRQLNELVLLGEAFLKDKGYNAYAQTTDRVKIENDFRTALPHKTVAVRAGLGWIGKNGLLVTEKYGSAIRISSLLTNAPLECAEAVSKSRCGECNLCVKVCPAQALTGAAWEKGLERAAIVDVQKCFNKQIVIMKEKTGIEADLCGKCFAVCVYTKRYLQGKRNI